MAQSPLKSRAQTYLDRAAEARRMADIFTGDPEHRQVWDAIAKEWERMAGEVVQQNDLQKEA